MKQLLTCCRRTAAVLWMSVATAAAAQIGDVKYEQQGSQRLPELQIAYNVQLRPGMEFRREILDEDIKRLFASGNFSDVVSEVKERPDGKVDVVFKLRLKPRISSIKYQGNVKYDVATLAKNVTLSEGGLLRDREFTESRNKLIEFYHKNGYTDAKVNVAVMPEDKENVSIIFQIEEHLKQRVNDVFFEGANLFSQWDLRHSIANQYSYWNWLPFVNDHLNRGLFDRQELEMDKARLREKYQEAGYLDFKVEDVTISAKPDDPEYLNLTFKVVEGEPYKVGKVTVSGNTVYSLEQLAPLIRLTSDAVFSLADESATSRGITGLYETLGYADVSCSPKRTEDFQTHTVDVDFVINEGRKYSIRDVVINGNSATKDKVIRRELAIAPGDPADRNRIEVSRQRLLGMGYFDKVEANAVGADALDEKDVVFNVQEKESRYNLRVGAGASDVNSFFGMAEISTDNFDITNPGNWFYGGGQRFRLQGVLGIDNAGFNADFVEPWLFDIPLRFELSGYMNQVVYDNWDEDRVGGRTSLSYKFFDDFTTFTVGYKFERVNVTNISHRLEEYMHATGQTDPELVSQPSLMIGRDTRNSLTEPTSGYNINLFGSVTPKLLGSTKNYYRLEAKGSYYYSFFDEAIVTMVGGKIGTVSGFDRDDPVPIFERYFLGGTGSLRGFEYRTVSPTVGHGNNIGGQTMLRLTAEVSHPIWGPLRGVAFVDAGNAWADSYSMNLSGINVGAGYGLRLKLPQLNAPIEIDLAYPIVNNQDYEPSKLRVHFNIGMGLTF